MIGLPDVTENQQAVQASTPNVEEFDIEGKLMGDVQSIKAKFQNLPFYLVKLDGNELSLIKVESRSITKRPYLFHIIKITPDKVSLIYSYIQDTSVNLRRAEVLKNLSDIMVMVSDQYSLNQAKLLQYVDSALSNLISGLSQNYTTLYNRYDSLLTEYRELKRLNIELSASNRNLTIQSSQIGDENKTLKTQLSALQKFSDESLMALIEEWLTVHNNYIDIMEFSKSNNVSPTRIEQMLDKMVSLGYIEVKG